MRPMSVGPLSLLANEKRPNYSFVPSLRFLYAPQLYVSVYTSFALVAHIVTYRLPELTSGTCPPLRSSGLVARHSFSIRPHGSSASVVTTF